MGGHLALREAMTYPLALRDALYAAFLRAHRFPDRVARFSREAKTLGRSRFVAQKTARYRKALAAWTPGAPGDLESELALALLLFKNGLYFETHEYLETAWKRSTGERKTRLQGLIQLAAALHKLELDPKASEGARYLVSRGFEKLEGL
jgi:hypothetical protein